MSLANRAAASIAASQKARSIYSLHAELLGDVRDAVERRDVIAARRMLADAEVLRDAASALIDAATALLED